MTGAEWKMLEFLGYGAAAGLVGAMAKARVLQLPRIILEHTEGGETYRVLDVGFLAAPLLGAFLAAYFDGRPQTALAWGLAAGYAGPAAVNLLMDAVLAHAGLRTGGPVRARDEGSPATGVPPEPGP